MYSWHTMCGRKKRRERSPLCFDRSRCRLHRQCRVKMAIAVRGLNFQRNHLVCHRYIAINGNAHNSSPTKFSAIICLNNCKCRIPCSDYRCLSDSGICLIFFWVYLLFEQFVVVPTYIVLYVLASCHSSVFFFVFFHYLFARLCFNPCASFFCHSMHVGCWCAYRLF